MFQLNVKYYRKSKNLTQKELAEKSGLAQSYISELESKDRTKSPTLKTLEILAEVLDVEPLKLITYKKHSL